MSTKHFQMQPVSYIIVALTLLVLLALMLAPVFSKSLNPCSNCHRNYSQTLSITANQIPSSLTVGQTVTVTAVVTNTVNVNKVAFNVLSSVSASLRSQNGYFSVSAPTVSVGSLSAGGSSTLSWQITALSAGSDSAVFSSTAKNTHERLSFADTSTNSLTITALNPTPTLTPTPTPTPTLTPTPTPNPTPTPTTPTESPTPIPTQTPTPTATQTLTPTPSLTSTPTPTFTSTSTPAPTPTLPPTVTTTPTSTPKPTTNPTPTPSPTPTSLTSTVSATTERGTTVDLTISGTIVSSQMSNVTILTNQGASTTILSFTITGEIGTTGFSNITIPKNLLNYPTTPKIYIDNQLVLEQSYTQNTNNYYIWYTTSFSTHEVSILFMAISRTGTVMLWTQNPMIYLIVAKVAIFLLVTVGLVLRTSKKRNRRLVAV